MPFTCVPVVAQWGTISYINTNQASCAAGEWAVFTPSELAAYNATLASAPSSFLPTMTVAEALPIFSAIAVIWGAAFAIRAVASLLTTNSGESQND